MAKYYATEDPETLLYRSSRSKMARIETFQSLTAADRKVCKGWSTDRPVSVRWMAIAAVDSARRRLSQKGSSDEKRTVPAFSPVNGGAL
jgi:hypothetical protein